MKGMDTGGSFILNFGMKCFAVQQKITLLCFLSLLNHYTSGNSCVPRSH